MPAGQDSPPQPGYPYPPVATPFVPAQRTALPPVPPFVPAQRDAPPAGLDGSAPASAIIRRERRRSGLVSLAVAGLCVLFAAALLAVLPALAPAPAPGPSLATAEAITDWYDGGGKVVLGALHGDLRSMNQAMTGNDLAGVASACGKLQSDVSAAQRFTPMPDTVARMHFAAALDHFGQGSASCLAGVGQMDLTLMSQAGDEFKAGSDQITLLNARLVQVSGV